MILIACGLQREAKLLAAPNIVAVPGGGNAAGLEAALENQLEFFPDVALILSCGIAGALDPALGVGDVVLHIPPFVPSDVEGRARGASPDARVSASLDTNGLWRLEKLLPEAHHGAILGQDHIAASPAEKARLHAATGALAVDMESHVAARVAQRHGLPFAAIRVISDTARDALPPAALVGMNPDGSMALGRVLASLARQPTQLPALIRIGRQSGKAFARLPEIAKAIAALPGVRT
ncbi:MAG: phosphorylase [Sphingomonas sp.]